MIVAGEVLSAASEQAHRRAVIFVRRIVMMAMIMAGTIAPAGAAAPGDEPPGLHRALVSRAGALETSRDADGPDAQPPASQPPASEPARAGREMYISWGYNADLFRQTDLHIAQPAFGNDFVLHDVHSHDQKGWTELFQNSLTTSQYSARVGYFFNAKQDLAIELNFEHVRYVVTQDQDVRMTGSLNSARVDQFVKLTDAVLQYKLNNGANFLLVNLVKRLPLTGKPPQGRSLAVLLKGGAGIGVPHPTNFVFDQANEPGFQFGGLVLGLEGTVRFHIFRPLYVEFAQKGVYAHYSGLEVYEGRAAHDIWTYLTAFSIGTSFSLPGGAKP